MRAGRHHPFNLLCSALTVMAMVVIASLGTAPSALTAQEVTTEVTEAATPPETPTPTATATEAPTATETITATPTATETPPSPTWTPIVQTVEVPATVIVPATVVVPATVIVPAPVIPLPTAIPVQPTPAMTATRPYGWTRHESIELIQVIGSWALVRDRGASDGAYHESASAGATLRFPFTGDGLRLIYRAHPQGGRFAVVLDGVVQGVYDTRADEAGFYFAGPFFFTGGYHVVDVVALAERSGVTSIVIDALDVFNGPPMPTVPAPTQPAESEPVEAQREVASIVQIAQPPPVQPTATPIPEALVAVEVVIAYDLNRNRSPDADEGVQGMSVRLLDGDDNRLLASGLTDERGYVRLQALTRGSVTAVVPYLGETFTVRAGRGRAQSARWTLLIPAGTQPGLIP